MTWDNLDLVMWLDTCSYKLSWSQIALSRTPMPSIPNDFVSMLPLLISSLLWHVSDVPLQHLHMWVCNRRFRRGISGQSRDASRPHPGSLHLLVRLMDAETPHARRLACSFAATVAMFESMIPQNKKKQKLLTATLQVYYILYRKDLIDSFTNVSQTFL